MNEVLCRYPKLTFFGQLLIILLQNIIKNLYSAVKVYHLLLFFFFCLSIHKNINQLMCDIRPIAILSLHSLF